MTYSGRNSILIGTRSDIRGGTQVGLRRFTPALPKGGSQLITKRLSIFRLIQQHRDAISSGGMPTPWISLRPGLSGQRTADSWKSLSGSV